VPGRENYPNPYYGGLRNINLSSIRGISVLTIFDEACRPVRELVLNNQSKVSLDADFPRGMYIISLNNRGRSIMTKLMVN